MGSLAMMGTVFCGKEWRDRIIDQQDRSPDFKD